jgi:hypothetical protein
VTARGRHCARRRGGPDPGPGWTDG